MTRIERFDPTRPDELVGSVPASTPADVDRLVALARATFRVWSGTPFEDRAAALGAAADAVEALLDDGTPELLCRELGKVLVDCRGEIGFAAAYLRDAVARARTIVDHHEVVDDGLGRMEVRREPHGVVAAITPWNAPIILSMLKIAPALATGNTIIVKPSPLAPLAVTRVVKAMAAHLPDGALAIVHGDAEVGRALTGNPDVAKVAFTGGLATGSAIARHVADRAAPLVLELGGNDAAVLLDDVDLDDVAIDRLVQASFITSGQVCMAAKRIYVHRSRIDEVVDRYREVAARTLVTGDPLVDGVTLGPLVTEEARDRVAHWRPGREPPATTSSGSVGSRTRTSSHGGGSWSRRSCWARTTPTRSWRRSSSVRPSRSSPSTTTRRRCDAPTTASSGSGRRCGRPTRSAPSGSRADSRPASPS